MFDKFKRDNCDILSQFKKENERLKRENYHLQEKIDEFEHLRKEYKDLIDKLHGMQSKYESKLREFDLLEKNFRKEVEKITISEVKNATK